MSKFVNVASVQFVTKAERELGEARNIILQELDKAFTGLRGYGLDLVVFCEGVEAYGQSVDSAEDVSKPGAFLRKYIEFATSEKCHVAGSMKTTRGGKAFNSIVFVSPKGDVLGVYEKSNLTQGEHEIGLTPGDGAVVVESEIGRLGGIICFDLNFEWLRNEYRAKSPDILCFASMFHGGIAQEFWAYDCRSFLASSLYFHGCGIRDPFGRPLAMTDCYNTVAKTRINLDRAMVHLDFNREKFPDIERKYKGEVIVDVPANIGPALIYSMTPKRTAMDIVEEFKLELLDDYLDRSLKLNGIPPGKARGDRGKTAAATTT